MAETAGDERSIGAELRSLDDRLFLDREFDKHTGVLFYTVKYHRGDQPPDLILDWRDVNDRPRPLSSGVTNEVRRMMQSGTVEEKIAKARKRQGELNEQKRDRLFQQAAEVAQEWERYDQVRSGLLPRGQWLRQSRDRMRARGRKV